MVLAQMAAHKTGRCFGASRVLLCLVRAVLSCRARLKLLAVRHVDELSQRLLVDPKLCRQLPPAWAEDGVAVQVWAAGVERWAAVLELGDLPAGGRCKVQLLSAAADRGELRRFAAESLQAHDLGSVGWMGSPSHSPQAPGWLAGIPPPPAAAGRAAVVATPDGPGLVTAGTPIGTLIGTPAAAEDRRLGWAVVTALAVEQAVSAVVGLQAAAAAGKSAATVARVEAEASRHRKELAKRVWVEQAACGLVQLQAAAAAGCAEEAMDAAVVRHEAELQAALAAGAAGVVLGQLAGAAEAGLKLSIGRSMSEEERSCFPSSVSIKLAMAEDATFYYYLEVSTANGTGDEMKWLVRKRYSHFVDLRKMLVHPAGWGPQSSVAKRVRENAVTIGKLPFPQKVRFPGQAGNPTVGELAAARKIELASWTNAVCLAAAAGTDVSTHTHTHTLSLSLWWVFQSDRVEDDSRSTAIGIW